MVVIVGGFTGNVNMMLNEDILGEIITYLQDVNNNALNLHIDI